MSRDIKRVMEAMKHLNLESRGSLEEYVKVTEEERLALLAQSMRKIGVRP